MIVVTDREIDPLVAAWRELTARHAAGFAALERELGERHGLGVSEFEVLDRLAECEKYSARAQDLADAVHLSQSAMSRLVDRLARHGLVERCVCEMDRRGIYVVLTPEGERRRAEAAPTHRAVLSEVLAGAPAVRSGLAQDTLWFSAGSRWRKREAEAGA